MTGANGEALTTKICKGGGIHNFLGRLTSEAAPVPGLAGLTLLRVNRYREAHILHSFLSVQVGTSNPNCWLFGCCKDLPPEGLPAIIEITVASFAARRGIRSLPLENHIINLEKVSPSSWQTIPC